MKNRTIAILLLLGLTATNALFAQPVSVPAVIRYQGRISKDKINYNGPLQFRFAFITLSPTGVATTRWKNAGPLNTDDPPDESVRPDVTDGLFVVALGDKNITGMKHEVQTSVTDNRDLHLRIWVQEANGSLTARPRPTDRVRRLRHALGECDQRFNRCEQAGHQLRHRRAEAGQ